MASVSNPVRHILLTGQPGVGKTTLVQKACESLSKSGKKLQGFYTEEVRAGRERIGFDVVTLDSTRGPLARVADEDISSGGQKYTVGKYTVKLHSFEQTALPTLISKTSGVPCIFVIDEIGKMEIFSQSFKKAVKNVMDSPKTTVLATIPVPKGRPIPFVEEVRARKDAVVFTVTKENRNGILEDILSAVNESIIKYGT
ncbi:hypothetical protein ACJMK2_037537 [Sinanodonta woodiana]|uniref:AAA+ ATPase domain-containing protein n=1 Tax=Sinanodonta woodiana TaxID=1069815 RepID=A0ABD3WMS3_SINWO